MSKLHRWARKGAWSIVDQALFASSNFALNLVLARWLSPEEYGAFAIAYSLLWFMTAFHNALLIEPLMVFGPGKYAKKFTKYLSTLVLCHLVFSVLQAVLYLLGALYCYLFGIDSMVTPLLLLTLATPMTLYLWMLRRACYIEAGPFLSVQIGVLYMATMLGGIYGLRQLLLLDANTALLLLGLSGLFSGLVLSYRLNLGRYRRIKPAYFKEVCRLHWDFGRWSSAARLLQRLPESIYPILLSATVGLGATGAIRAMSNLINPIMQVTVALTNVLQPSFVRRRDKPRFMRSVLIGLGGITGLLGLYWLGTSLFALPLMSFLYNDKYNSYAYILWIMGLVPLVNGITTFLGRILQVLELPERLFTAFLLSTPVGFVISVPLILSFGIDGVVWGRLFSAIIGLAVTSYMLTGPLKQGFNGARAADAQTAGDSLNVAYEQRRRRLREQRRKTPL